MPKHAAHTRRSIILARLAILGVLIIAGIYIYAVIQSTATATP